MIFSQDRDTLRRMYADAWQKRRGGIPLSPLETEIAEVVAEHPEYHAALDAGALERDYAPEGGRTNPFLHMGLHLGLREQLATDRPPGIAGLYPRIVARCADAHVAEHRMIECLAETLWEAQAGNTAPDEARFLERLQRVAGDL
jgi:hypothetical protein